MEFISQFRPSANVPRQFVYHRKVPVEIILAPSGKADLAPQEEVFDAAVILTELDAWTVEWRVELRQNPACMQVPLAGDYEGTSGRAYWGHGYVDGAYFRQSSPRHLAAQIARNFLTSHQMIGDDNAQDQGPGH